MKTLMNPFFVTLAIQALFILGVVVDDGVPF